MFLFIYFILLPQISETAICQKFDYLQSDAAVPENFHITLPSSNAVLVNYTCPGVSDPKQHTECCTMKDKKGCCPRARYFYEIDKHLAAAIALSVISICTLLAVFICLCCFWERCPLYISCRQELSPEIASYVSKEDNIDMDTMPREISRKNKFSPVAISNGNIPSGVDMEAI